MQVAVGGSSGFLGGHLCAELEQRGHRVVRLVRRAPEGPDESRWDPAAGDIDTHVIHESDVVVNLAGSPTIGNPHSSRWATELRESRVMSTGLLAEAIATAPGAKPAFLAGNGISWYGDHGTTELPETADTRGHGLLTEVCRDWQAATAPAQDAGARVCILRTSPVMDGASMPLKAMRLQFRAGLGGRLGSGRQHMPMISLRDWIGAVAFLAEHPTAAGPVNLCSTRTPTNAEFTAALARAVGRPAFAHVPGPAIRLAAGPMAPEVLNSLNTVPAALADWGHEMSDPDVAAIVANGLS
ncbi:TIGR01777 family oxidoreductase [Nocardioides panacisoli]|uniref:TIGR01777 family oxidoreductase n=1 Tax=Nocardioides panacisoli TaxID=627624 RepID=UPI001F01F088|nr:TIGR01777 family oxidoreductase [Nocardioides panacisoli]